MSVRQATATWQRPEVAEALDRRSPASIRTRAANINSTPKVRHAYTEMSGGANHSRLTVMTYLDGYVVNYNYSSGLNDSISQLSLLLGRNKKRSDTIDPTIHPDTQFIMFSCSIRRCKKFTMRVRETTLLRRAFS